MLSIEEYKAIFDATPDGVVVVAADGLIRAVNPKTEQMFGWSADELQGRPVEMLLPETLRSAHEAHRSGFVEDPHERPMGVGLDLVAERKDGSRFPLEVSLSPWHQEGEGLQVICSVRDTTAVRRLRNFSEGALRASEEERRRIARELHDDTAQRLATLILRVGALARESDDVRRKELFDQVRAEIVDAAEGVKRMARGLRPPELEELGLELALQAHARTLRESADFHVRIEGTGVDGVLGRTAKLALYRIIQEAVSNARRHSGVGSAHVRLVLDDESVIAEILDHGAGFSPAGAAQGDRGLGLVGMQERAAMIGGRMTVDSVPGKGTAVRVTVPIDRGRDDG